VKKGKILVETFFGGGNFSEDLFLENIRADSSRHPPQTVLLSYGYETFFFSFILVVTTEVVK